MSGVSSQRCRYWGIAALCLSAFALGCQRGHDAREELGDAAKEVAREETAPARTAETPAIEPVSNVESPTARPASANPAAAQRRPAPEFRLQDLDGKEVRLSSLRGKVVMVNFWATWCPPCKAEIPDFIELQRELGPKGFEIVGISFDQKGAPVVRAFAEQRKINYRMLLGSPEVARDYGGVSSIPTTFLVDRAGRIVTSRTGVAAKQVWRQAIVELLNES